MVRFLFSLLICLPIAISAQTAFTIYNTTNSELPDNLVNTIYMDASENMWIGTQTGLVKIDTDENWTIYNKTNSGLPENDIRAIFVDDENNLWVGVYLNGLVKYNGVDWINYTTDNSDIPDNNVEAINKDVNDTMWIGSKGGLTKWDGADFWYTYNSDNSNLKSSNIPAILIDENDVKFLGSINGGLSTYDHGIINYYRTENSDIGDNTILAIEEDIYHNKWLATSFGGVIVVTEDFTFLNFNIATSDIPDLSVDDVAVDSNQIGVLGMATTGLVTFDNTNWTILNTLNSAIPEDNINTVLVDKENRIWAGTEASGFFILDRELLSATNQEVQDQIEIIPNPAADILILTGCELNSTIEIYDLTGKLWMQNKLFNSNSFISLKNIPDGNYIITIRDKTAFYTKQLTVMH